MKKLKKIKPDLEPRQIIQTVKRLGLVINFEKFIFKELVSKNLHS